MNDAPVKLRRPRCGLGIAEYLDAAAPWFVWTFGPGDRSAALFAHILKECDEIRAAPSPEAALEEWADVLILALEGAYRTRPVRTVAGVEGDASGDIETRLLRLLVMTPYTAAWENIDEVYSSALSGPETAGHGVACDLFLSIAVAAISELVFLGAGTIEPLFTKLEKNMARKWPDWRAVPAGTPIEHIRK